jgi:hypothetical protein
MSRTFKSMMASSLFLSLALLPTMASARGAADLRNTSSGSDEMSYAGVETQEMNTSGGNENMRTEQVMDGGYGNPGVGYGAAYGWQGQDGYGGYGYGQPGGYYSGYYSGAAANYPGYYTGYNQPYGYSPYFNYYNASPYSGYYNAGYGMSNNPYNQYYDGRMGGGYYR